MARAEAGSLYGWLRRNRRAAATLAAVGGSALALLVGAAGASASTVLAWGENRYGQLGTGGTAATAVPVPVEEIGEVASFSAGGRNSEAVLANGAVEGWGSDGFGELGDESTTVKQFAPVLASGLSEATAVSAGHKFTVALRSDGTVWTWGNNKYGQLGNGTFESSGTPAPVSGLSGVKQVSAGFFHTLALREDGTVMAWGNGDYGELGNGSTANSPVPIQVPGLSHVVQVAAGCIHSIALLSDGTVVSFGGNEYAQLGHGARLTKRTAVPEPVLGLSGVKAIAAGLFYNLALLNNGTVMAWGYNRTGQLGNGTQSIINGTPTPVTGLSEVTAISAAQGSMSPERTSQHSLALTASGAVYGWGGNEFGQVGDGTTNPALTPVPVVGLSSGVKAISAGGFHSLAIR